MFSLFISRLGVVGRRRSAAKLNLRGRKFGWRETVDRATDDRAPCTFSISVNQRYQSNAKWENKKLGMGQYGHQFLLISGEEEQLQIYQWTSIRHSCSKHSYGPSLKGFFPLVVWQSNWLLECDTKQENQHTK